MSGVSSPRLVKVSGSMVAKPINVRVGGTWKGFQNVTGELYLSPGSGTYAVNSTMTIVIRENSYTTAVNSVGVTLTYPSGLLQFQTSSTSGTSFDTPAQVNTGGSGTVTIALSSVAGTITGDQLVSTLSFTVLAAGTASLAFSTSGSGSGIARTSDNANICNQLLGGTYTLQ